MIISRLTLFNFGVYAGKNTFEFHNEKPIVLIGGLNGLNDDQTYVLKIDYIKSQLSLKGHQLP